jgi:hypothetical protein
MRYPAYTNSERKSRIVATSDCRDGNIDLFYKKLYPLNIQFLLMIIKTF